MGVFKIATKGYRLYKAAGKEGITIFSFFDDVEALVRLVKAVYNKEYTDIKKRNFLKVALGFLYLFSFIDLVPDFIPFIGWVDDVAVLFVIYRSLKTEIDKFKVWEKGKPKILKPASVKNKKV